MDRAPDTAGRRLVACFCVLGLIGSIALPASAGAESAISLPGMELAFGTRDAHNIGNEVAVPVECYGEEGGFCSGVVTLSRGGRRTSVPVSVRGGAHESVFVPLRLAGAGKLRGIATTDQRLGPPSTTETFLYVH
jgi:hypothetical protein